MEFTIESVRSRYLAFFAERGHAVIPSASLLPDGDPSVLFTTAGMHPLVPYLLGQPHPSGERLVGYQGCLRTSDIEEVGDATHLTFFEMLGNWSLGDYGKVESIRLSFEFLTGSLGLECGRLWISVFAGDGEVARDEEAARTWRELGVPPQQIVFLGSEHNWWAAGPQGPCGPDTEIFFDRTGKPCDAGAGCHPGGCACERFVEIWNNVFMAYERRGDVLLELPRMNIDTGMGLERIVAALCGFRDVYEVDGMRQVMDRLASAAQRSNRTALRVAADHLRSAVFVLGDRRGVTPSNQGAGYVLRRLVRRALRYCGVLGISDAAWIEAAHAVVDAAKSAYPQLESVRDRIIDALEREAVQFAKVKTKGEGLLARAMDEARAGGTLLSGELAFKLYETYGFPLEFTREIAAEHGFSIDDAGVERCFAEHRERSRGERAKSGLTDSSIESVRLHTATHLLHAALRSVLGEHVEQRGSNITPERLRFDFSHPAPMTKTQLEQTEAWVQGVIDEDHAVVRRVTTPQDASNDGALGLFGDRYADRVSVYAIGDRSLEVCAGPHVERTSDLGRFRILKEQSCAAGIRRIRAGLSRSR